MRAYDLDQVMHTLGKNAMALWLKIFLKNGASEGGHLIEFNWKNAKIPSVWTTLLSEKKP